MPLFIAVHPRRISVGIVFTLLGIGNHLIYISFVLAAHAAEKRRLGLIGQAAGLLRAEWRPNDVIKLLQSKSGVLQKSRKVFITPEMNMRIIQQAIFGIVPFTII